MSTRVLCVVLAVCVLNSTKAAVMDSAGMHFTTSESLCAYHCSRHMLQRSSDCASSDCMSNRRWLQPEEEADTNVTTIGLMQCASIPQASSTLDFEWVSFSPDNARNAFRTFATSFFQAYDALSTSPNATFDACQLQFLQSKLLPEVTSDSTSHVVDVMLVQLEREDIDEQECVQSIKDISSNDKFTPFVTRRDDVNDQDTVLLVRLTGPEAEEINDLSCVASVLQLPPILKLVPFARSCLQSQQSDSAPPLEIRLANEANKTFVLSSFQSQLETQFGISNVFTINSKSKANSLFTRSLANMQTWTYVVALAISSSSVEWIDVKLEMSQNSLSPEHPLLIQTERRLDEFAMPLVGVESVREKGLTGTDVIVGVTDSGLYLDHDQFDQKSRKIYDDPDQDARKVVYYNAWANRQDESNQGTCGHGTHVSGLLAGSSYSGKFDDLGIASSAKIAFMDIGELDSSCTTLSDKCPVHLSTPADAGDLLESQMKVGAKIFSFSWGTPGSDYSDQARDLDDFIYNNPGILLVVAAGNGGDNVQSSNPDGAISSPSGAKNVISVGASLNSVNSFIVSDGIQCQDVYNQYAIASFSSPGPTSDGRMKPDVVAPGLSLVSAESMRPGVRTKTGDLCSLQGTSQATPMVAGIAVLLYEWLRDGWWKAGVKDEAYGMKNVPASLLKALVVHSGESLNRRLGPMTENTVISCTGLKQSSTNLKFPDRFQGYGRPNVSSVIDFATDQPSLVFLPNSSDLGPPRVSHGESVYITFTVPKNVTLRATLVWTDPPGSVHATSQLQHDLDLAVSVRNASSKTFVPATAEEGIRRDRRNNVEMVLVSYDDLLAAAKDASNGSFSAVGPNGEIEVDAVVYGRSVLQNATQEFSFVASSSSIKVAANGNGGPESDGWSAWMTVAIAVGCVLLLLVGLFILGACLKRKRRKLPVHARGVQNLSNENRYTHGPPEYYVDTSDPVHAHIGSQGGHQCPFCQYRVGDAVILVNHVEVMHADPTIYRGNGRSAGQNANGDASVNHCPFCSFQSPDAVILVNHVEHMHKEQ